jgi:hypothetical protein
MRGCSKPSSGVSVNDTATVGVATVTNEAVKAASAVVVIDAIACQILVEIKLE